MANSNQEVYTRCGTPLYLAPEIFLQDGYLGAPADIWSYGIILYVMLTGSYPFEADNIPDLSRLIANVSIDYPSDLPPKAVELLKKIIVSDPKERYTVEQIKKDPWFNEEEPREEVISAFEFMAKMSSVNFGKGKVSSTTLFSTTKEISAIRSMIDSLFT